MQAQILEAAARTITPAELYARACEGGPLEILDVRTPAEFAGAHVGGAKPLPLGDLDAEAFARIRRAGSPLYVICQGGTRARTAIEMLRRAGCEDGVLVEGGTHAWIDAGLPVVRGTSKVLPLMRQVQIVVGAVSAIGALLALTVNPWFAAVPLLTGCGLLIAGLTGMCGMALLLARMPWNRTQAVCGDGCNEVER